MIKQLTQQSSLPLEWPPAYTLRRSTRARKISLRISAGKGLEVVLPERTSERTRERIVTSFIEQHRDWIERHLPVYLNQAVPEAVEERPSKINLRAINQEYDVEYYSENSVFSVIKNEANIIIVRGKIHYKRACRQALRKWIKQVAAAYLAEKIEVISREINIPFQSLAIRAQKTRWGSCSSLGEISLNYKLIFLPNNWVRYIIIHELCHVVHHNHSENFWSLVASFMPDCQAIRQALRRDKHCVPGWVERI